MYPDSEDVTTFTTSMGVYKYYVLPFGFCNFFRQFIKGFLKIVKPLTRLSLKDRPYEWTEACQAAFDLLKKTVTEASVLRHFDRNREAFLEANSSNFVVGGVLFGSTRSRQGNFPPRNLPMLGACSNSCFVRFSISTWKGDRVRSATES